MLWYKNILFRCIPKISYVDSKSILWFFLVVSIIIGTFISFRYKRDEWNVAVCVLLPYGLYTVLAYRKTMKLMIIGILFITVIWSIIHIVCYMSKKVKKRTETNKCRVLKYRIYNCLYFVQSSFAVAMILIMVLIGGRGIFGIGIMNSSSVKAISGLNKQQQTISNNIETIIFLQEEEWVKLQTQEKIEVIQCVANIEACCLGLPHELNVAVSNLRKSTLACYDDDTYTIYIDLDYLESESPYGIVTTLCHEARHAFQHRLIDAYNNTDEEYQGLSIYSSAISYAQEFSDYDNGDENFDDYYYQNCEVDSREYAESEVINYYDQIYLYLNYGNNF